jgi:hypothetical protein
MELWRRWWGNLFALFSDKIVQPWCDTHSVLKYLMKIKKFNGKSARDKNAIAVPAELFVEKCDAEWWITRKYWSFFMRFLQST